MSKRRKNNRSKAPDEYFTIGPLEFSRFERLTIMRSLVPKEQFEAIKIKMASNLPKVTAEIDTLVTKIADRIAYLPPGLLLQRAWWEYAAIAIDFGNNKICDLELTQSARMIDYVHSIIVSIKPSAQISDELSDTDWDELKGDVTSLFMRLTIEYQMCKTANLLIENPEADMEQEEFRFRAETYWLNIRGKRYQPHESLALLDILIPHSDILIRLFGVDAPTLVTELNKVLTKLTSGMQCLFDDLTSFQEKVLNRCDQIVEQTSITDFYELRNKVYEDKNLATQMNTLMGELCGLDFFDVEKITCLPKPLLDQLTWSPGEETEFFKSGDFCGWPVHVWPIMRRPFIRIDNQILCFDMFSLFDNIYRALQRIICRLSPDYSVTWNERQAAVSEELPFTYFGRILPGARIFHSVYYHWKTGAGKAQWHETDGLLIYEDHLFILEVKAGSYTYKSPVNDMDSHRKSIQQLVQKAANQGNRFFDYLESADEISIANADHKEIGILRRSDFRHITICAVTLDPFTQIAARAQHLNKIDIDIGKRPVWVLSIDDIRVYADLFDNPLIFLHFVEQRISAACSDLVDLNDEMSHIGLYFSENNYSQYADDLVSNDHVKLTLDGFRTPIDEYYRSIIHGLPIVPLNLGLPPRFAEIVAFLAQSSIRGRAKLSSFLLDIMNPIRQELAAAIDQQLNDNIILRRARSISTYGDNRLTLYCWSPAGPRKIGQAIDDTRAVMILSEEKNRISIELEYCEKGMLQNVHWQDVGITNLSETELSRLRTAAAKLRQQRIASAQEKNKIGRNERCPCGSQKKFKHCCLS
ncbi:TPA: preprotein translocase subunit SecA [Legionella pneumophila]|nr:preprotein translocase subunit SecA [Legionella pneumophila]